MKALVILLSGGFDSVTLLHYLKHKYPQAAIHALGFNYGQRHTRELKCAVWQTETLGVCLKVLDLGVLRDLAGHATALIAGAAVPAMRDLAPDQLDQPSTYVPNRNLLFLTLAAAYAESCGIQDIFYAAQHQERYSYWDCTEEFLQKLNCLLALNRRAPVEAHAPLIALNKAEILRIGLELGVDYSQTWTCYKGEDLPCSVCPSCIERATAFQAVGLSDPLILSCSSGLK